MLIISHLLTYGAPYIRASLLPDNCQYYAQIGSEYDFAGPLYSELFPCHSASLPSILLSRTAIAIQTANLIQCVSAPSRSVRRLPGHRPDQDIHRADTPHTGASGAWLSFDGHTYVLIY